MDITMKEAEGHAHLSFAGRLDATSAPEAEEQLKKCLDDGNNKLLIDMKGLDYISSAGLRVLLVVAKRLRQSNGKIALCQMVDSVKEVFDISGFSSIFNIFDTESEAVDNLG